MFPPSSSQNDSLIALVLGTLLGIGLSIVFLHQRQQQVPTKTAPGDRSEDDDDDDKNDEDDEEEEDEEEYDSDNGFEEYKMVMVVNHSLGMTKGKMVAQCCHACLGAYKKASKDSLKIWSGQGQAKITLKGENEDTLRRVAQYARKSNLPYYLVTDAGRTQIASGSITVCSLGPAPASEIDKLTGGLKLL